MEIRQVLHDEVMQAGLREGPEHVIRHVEAAQLRGAQLIARTARLNAARHAAFSTLTNSIAARKVGELHFEVRAATNYARALEEGTGPAAGRAPYMPNPVHLQAYVKRRANIRWQGRPGSQRRRDLMREVRDRAWALAVHIRKHGTKPHPYMAPAAEQHRAQLLHEMRLGAYKGAAAAFQSRLAELRR